MPKAQQTREHTLTVSSMNDHQLKPSDFTGKKVLVIGDVILDEYMHGTSTRLSPEAPVPVVRLREYTSHLGGAANVAANLASLGAEATLISVVGDDVAGRKLMKLAGAVKGLVCYLFPLKDRKTTLKTRVLSGVHHFLRIDWEDDSLISITDNQPVISAIITELNHADVVIISDYAKGVISQPLMRRVLSICEELDVKVLVDPKSRDFSLYGGCYAITPNVKELFGACGKQSDESETLFQASLNLMEKHLIENFVITRGEKGMLVLDSGTISKAFFNSTATEVIDVSGAGDTVIAVLALLTACDRSITEAAYYANRAAGLVVAKPGTATLTAEELCSANFPTGVRP